MWSKFNAKAIKGSPALIVLIGWGWGTKDWLVTAVSGRCNYYPSNSTEIQISDKFDLDGQQIVFINTPDIRTADPTKALKLISAFLAESYSTGMEFTGIIYFPMVPWGGFRVISPVYIFREQLSDKTLEVFIKMGDSDTDESQGRQFTNVHPKPAIYQGAQFYGCSSTPDSARGILQMALGNGPVTPETQLVPYDEGRGSGKIGGLPERRDEEIKELKESMRKAMETEVKELEEQKSRAEGEANHLRKRIAEMQREEEQMRQGMHQVEKRCQELEEQKGRAQGETDDLRTRVAEIQSEFEEDQPRGPARLPFDRSSPHFGDQLNKALHAREYERWVKTLQEDDLVWFVDYLDKALDTLDPSGPASRKCLRELGSICATHTTLPTSYTILSHLLTINPRPFDSGGFGEVYRGTLNGSPVCVKRLRVAPEEDLAVATQMFCKEAVMWKGLKHPNILPLLGATVSPPQLVSVLIPAGNLSKYIAKNPDANRVGLLSEIAEVLRYLHSRNVIHGDLKGMNILVDVVDNIPHARIADFGIAIVTKNLDSIRPATRQEVHTPRWSAPEIFLGQNPSKKTDVYSFAMVVIEALSGQVPFSSEKTNWTVAPAVLGGKRPTRPAHPSCTDGLWVLIQRCWAQDPQLRPEILEVSQHFSFVSTDWGVRS